MTEEQQAAAARRAQIIITAARDGLIVTGVGLVALGVYQIYVPAGHITLGALLAAMGLRGILRG